MRFFLGLKLPSMHRDALEAQQRDLPPGRCVPWDNFHLTLVFLGDGTDAMADELDQTLDGMRLALPCLTLDGFDQFGGAAPRAVWVGVKEQEPLVDLNARLENSARRAGFDIPRRRFMPHVTLTRFARDQVDPSAIAGFFDKKGGFSLPAFQPLAVTLFQSHLRAHGPDYETLAEYPVTPDPTI